MKRYTLAIVAALSLALFSIVSANAADALRSRYTAPSYNLASTFNWTGFYAGGTVGYGMGTADSSNLDTLGFTNPLQVNTKLRGALLGGTVGYNHQIGKFVVGAEADYSMANMKGSGVTDTTAFGFVPVSASVNSQLNTVGTLRGRLGYLFGEYDRYLAYVTGGYAYGTGTVSGSTSIFGTPIANFSGSGSLKGWAWGGGIEAKITRDWSAKVEYLHIDLGSMDLTMPTFAGPVTVSNSFKTDIVRVGLNYRF